MSRKKEIPPKEELENLYAREEISSLASLYSISIPTIKSWLKFYDIPQKNDLYILSKEEIIDFLRTEVSKNPYGYYKKIQKYKDLILSLDPSSNGNLNETIHKLINKIDFPPSCTVCSNPTSFKSVKDGYNQTCSRKCAGTIGGQERKKTDPKKHLSKMYETNLKRYGVKSTFETDIVKQKTKQSMLNRYGVEHPMHAQEFQNKVKETNNERYGTDYWFKTEESRKLSSDRASKMHKNDHFRKHFLNKYGVDHWLKTEEGIRYLLRQRNVEYLFDEIEDYLTGERLSYLSTKLGLSAHLIGKLIDFKGIDYTPIYHKSNFEVEIYEFLRENLDEETIIINDRELINPKELDFYIPSKNIAIECNGVYWHSTKYKKDKNYHYSKFKDCLDKGIELIQISDTSYYDNPEKWKQLLKVKLGFSSRKIYARNCQIKEITSKEAKKFVDENHLQGGIHSKINLGLFYETVLISVMTFSKPRFNKEASHELLRFCSLDDITVVGGFSKLLRHFERNHMKPGEILLSYSNCFWSTGNVYKTNGFQFKSWSGVNYWWTDGKVMIPRYKAQKHKLKEEFGDLVKSEYDFMHDISELERYYDAGNFVWEYKKAGN